MYLMRCVYTISSTDTIYTRQHNNKDQDMYWTTHYFSEETENYLQGWTKEFPEEHNTMQHSSNHLYSVSL